MSDDCITLNIEDCLPSEFVLSSPEQGPPGPPGPPAPTFLFTQNDPDTQWTINHNLGFNPEIEVRNAGNERVWARIVHTTDNQAIVYLNTPMAGTARCN